MITTLIQKYPELITTSLSALIGGFVTWIATKLAGKIKVFSYTYEMNRLALSTEDAQFGRIQVTWENNAVPNLYLATFRLENSSFHDFENVVVRIWCPPSIKMLQDNVQMDSNTFEIGYTEDYRNKISYPPESSPSDSQIHLYRSTRDYLLPVFNRGEILTIRVLCLSEDDSASIWMDVQKRGVRLKRRLPQQHFWGVPTTMLLPWTIFASISVVIALILLVINPWILALSALVVGLFGQVFGAIAFKCVRKIRMLISY